MDKRGDFQRIGEKIKMSNVIIMANKVTLNGIIDRVFLETIFVLRIFYSEHPSLPDYVEGVTKAGIKVKL